MRAICRRGAERGFTFTELTVVMVLASVVTLGLVTFYLNAQIVWTQSSTQVMAQRDGTAILEVMRDSVQTAANALVMPVAQDSLNKLVILYDRSGNEQTRFFWDPTDSCVHSGEGAQDYGPLTQTRAERFHVTYDQTLGILHVDSLRVRSSAGQQVTLSTSIGLYNQ